MAFEFHFSLASIAQFLPLNVVLMTCVRANQYLEASKAVKNARIQ